MYNLTSQARIYLLECSESFVLSFHPSKCSKAAEQHARSEQGVQQLQSGYICALCGCISCSAVVLITNLNCTVLALIYECCFLLLLLCLPPQSPPTSVGEYNTERGQCSGCVYSPSELSDCNRQGILDAKGGPAARVRARRAELRESFEDRVYEGTNTKVNGL